VWQAGVLAMLLYAVISYLRLRNRVKVSMPLTHNVYLSDGISSPFILGARIYLPSSMGGEEKEALRTHVLAHEYAHLKRGDHLWKPIAFALLSVYWFHPLLWVAYVLFCRDIEAACDERVVKTMDAESRKAYSTALLDCSIGSERKKPVGLSACPLAFGEVGVKARIRAVLTYKKPAFWLILLAIAVCLLAAVCFLTNPTSHAQKGLTVEGGGNSIMIAGGGSELDGVSVRIKSVNLSGELPSMTVSWINRREGDISCGAAFTLSRLVDGEWQDCDMLETRIFYAIAYIIQSGREHELSYGFSGMDLRESGRYRFETECTSDDEPVGVNGRKTYRVWIEFELEKGINADLLLPPATGEIVGLSENAVTYMYQLSPDWMAPSLTLDSSDKTFSFSYSGFSSYLPRGTYTLEADRLILQTDDGLDNVYVFNVTSDGYTFDASRSSFIPSYRYSADAKEVQCPVPDGALFRRVYTVSGQRQFSFPLDRCFYDIDGDGKDDAVTLRPGHTSGRSTVRLTVNTADNKESSILFDFYYDELSFEMTEEELFLVAKNEKGEFVRNRIVFDGRSVSLATD